MAERATQEAIDGYVIHLRTRYASTTAVAFLVSLLSALKVMAPKHDWRELQRTIDGLKLIAEPARNKRSRIDLEHIAGFYKARSMGAGAGRPGLHTGSTTRRTRRPNPL